MRKLIKIIFWFLIAALTAHTLTSCKKTEIPPNWYLDFSTPTDRFGNIPANAISDNIGADGCKVGLCLDFKSESFVARIFTFGDQVYQMTGLINGSSFILLNDSINICHGEQRVPVKFKIEYR